TNLRMLKAKFSQLGSTPSDESLNQFKTDLDVLIAHFRSPALGIGAESMKQELKTMEKAVEDSSAPFVPPAAKLATYNQILDQLQKIVDDLNQPIDNIRLSELRSVRQYKEEMERYMAVSQALEQNETLLDKARSS